MAIPVSLPGMKAPAAGFDSPFEMLADCHERVRRSLALLQRLVGHVTDHGADGQAQAAARDVLRYFDVAAPAHHEDEERHLVPLLSASPDAGLVEAATRLLSDHETIRAAWQALRPRLAEIAEQTRCTDLGALGAAAQRFVDVHAGHLELEDGTVFPAGAKLHPDPAAMGREMAARRGVDLAAAAPKR